MRPDNDRPLLGLDDTKRYQARMKVYWEARSYAASVQGIPSDLSGAAPGTFRFAEWARVRPAASELLSFLGSCTNEVTVAVHPVPPHEWFPTLQ